MEGHTYEVQFIIPRLPALQWQYELENPEIQIVKLQPSGNVEQLGGFVLLSGEGVLLHFRGENLDKM